MDIGLKLLDPTSDATIDRVLGLALLVESTLQNATLDFLDHPEPEDEQQQIACVQGASILAAWHRFLDEIGFPRAVMAEDGPQRHKSVATFLLIAEGEACPAKVESHLEGMRKFLAHT